MNFSLDNQSRRIEGQYAVYPDTLLFRAGEYPDKKFSITSEELTARAAAWKPIKGNILHTGFMEGRAGEINSAWTEEGGKVLRGEVRIPIGLDDLLSTDERKISLEFATDSKQPFAFALTRSPRIADAVLMSMDATPNAEFARHDTDSGQWTLQSIHDVAARGGATCKASNATNMSSSHEASTIQNIHDMACEHGAKCERKTDRVMYSKDALDQRQKAQVAGKERKMDWKKIFPILDRNNLLSDEEKAEFSQQAQDDATDKTVDFSQSPQYKEMLKKQQDNERELATMRTTAITERAESFYDAAFRAGRVSPAEKGSLIAQFSSAAEDDARDPKVVTFSVGTEEKKGTRVDVLKAAVEARPVNPLMGETLVTLFANKETTQTTNAELAEKARKEGEEYAAKHAKNGKGA